MSRLRRSFIRDWIYPTRANATYAYGAEGVVYSVGGAPAESSGSITATLLSGLNNSADHSAGGALLWPLMCDGRQLTQAELVSGELQLEVTTAPANASFVYAGVGFTAAGATFATANEWQTWLANYQPAGNPRTRSQWRNGGAGVDTAGATAAFTRISMAFQIRGSRLIGRQDVQSMTGEDTVVNSSVLNVQVAPNTDAPLWFLVVFGSLGGALSANRTIAVKPRYWLAERRAS